MWFIGLPTARVIRRAEEEEEISILDQYTREMAPAVDVIYSWKLGTFDLGKSKEPTLSSVGKGRIEALNLEIREYEGETILGRSIPPGEGTLDNCVPTYRADAAKEFVLSILHKVGVHEDLNVYHLDRVPSPSREEMRLPEETTVVNQWR